MFEVTIEKTFAAAHFLRDYHGKCERLHGHNYKVHVTVQGDRLAFNGLLVDFKDVKRLTGEALEKLDHYHLNEVPPFDELNPSAENIAWHIYTEVNRSLETVNAGVPVRVSEVRVWETDTCFATYRP